MAKEVEKFQRAMKEKGYDIKIDGLISKGTAPLLEQEYLNALKNNSPKK